MRIYRFNETIPSKIYNNRNIEGKKGIKSAKKRLLLLEIGVK